MIRRHKTDSSDIRIKMNRGQARALNHVLLVMIGDPNYRELFSLPEMNRIRKGRKRIAEAIWPDQIDRHKRGETFMDERAEV